VKLIDEQIMIKKKKQRRYMKTLEKLKAGC
jgi:hypothetical protein